MLYGAPQCEISQSWFVSCSIVSTYSTTMTKLMFPLLAPQLQEKNGGDALWCSSMGNSPSLVCLLLNCVNILHHNDQVNVTFSRSSIARKTMVDMLYHSPQGDIPKALFVSFSIVSTYSTTMTNEIFPLLAPQLQEKKWWRCSMVLLNGKFPKLGFFLTQLCLHSPPQ